MSRVAPFVNATWLVSVVISAWPAHGLSAILGAAAPPKPLNVMVEPASTYQLLVGSFAVVGYYTSPEAAWESFKEWQNAENERSSSTQRIVDNFRPCPASSRFHSEWNHQPATFCHDFAYFEAGAIIDKGTAITLSRGYVCPDDAMIEVKRAKGTATTVRCQLNEQQARTVKMSDTRSMSCVPLKYSVWNAAAGRQVTTSYCFKPIAQLTTFSGVRQASQESDSHATK